MFRIYLITCAINNKIYVGKTCWSIANRWSNHISCAKRGDDVHFYRAILKYGPENFSLKELDCTESEQQANWLESFYIGLLKSYDRKIGYNSTMGGDGSVPNAETLAKLRLVHDGPKNGRFRKEISDDIVIDLYVNQHIGPTKIAEIFNCDRTTIQDRLNRLNIPRMPTGAPKGSQHMLGVKRSEETKKKLSDIKKNSPAAIEHCRKMTENRILKTIAWG
jgi:group I intron endonuclease